jgi:L,D-transpeptidase ErfK/SrfK
MTGKFHISLSVRLALLYALAALIFLLFARASSADIGEPLGKHMYYRVAKGETYYDIAQKFDIGIGELRAANPAVNEAKLKAGTTIVLPTAHLMPDVPHEGIVINLPERRLYYFDDPSGPMSFPVTVGKEGWETPMGVTYIANKRTDPTWTVPDKIRAEDPELPAVVPPGPDNPLGKYAMDLGFNGIRIHGTNNPRSIGRQSSHGCIRMYPADIEKLFNLVPLKTKVTIINQPYKIGWLGNSLLLEVAPPAAGSVARSVSVSDVRAALERKVAGKALVDWETVDVAVRRRDGMPVSIGRRIEGPMVSQTDASYYTPPAQPAVLHVDKAASRTRTVQQSAKPILKPPGLTSYAPRYRTIEPPIYVIEGGNDGYNGGYDADTGQNIEYYANPQDEQ